MTSYGNAQQALAAQAEATHADDPQIAARLIQEINELIPQVRTSLIEQGYPRHDFAAYRASQVQYGDPPKLMWAWVREMGVGFTDYGYQKVPSRSMRVGILMDEANDIRIIGTQDWVNVAYGDWKLEPMTPPQLQALKIVCTQLCGPPKVPSWIIPPLPGHPD